MGVISVNCAISNHAIYRERIVGILVKKNKSSSSEDMPCYPNDLWRMDSFPFRGKANSYGEIIIDKTDKNFKLFKKFAPDYVLPERTLRTDGNVSWMFILEEVYDFLMAEESKYIQDQLEAEIGKYPIFLDTNRFNSLEEIEKVELLRVIGLETEKTALRFYANDFRGETVFSTSFIRATSKNKRHYQAWLEEAIKHMVLYLTFAELRRFIFPTHNVGNNLEDYKKLSKLDAFVAKRSARQYKLS